MHRNHRKCNPMNATLKSRPKTQRVLRHLMDQQQAVEIGERIRSLRENSAETNRSISDYCGVGERSVAAWVAGDGISYKNAKKVAEMFEVDIDWLWRGREKPEGSPLDVLSAQASATELVDLRERLDRIEQALALLLAERGLEQVAPPSEPARRQRTG